MYQQKIVTGLIIGVLVFLMCVGFTDQVILTDLIVRECAQSIHSMVQVPIEQWQGSAAAFVLVSVNATLFHTSLVCILSLYLSDLAILLHQSNWTTLQSGCNSSCSLPISG